MDGPVDLPPAFVTMPATTGRGAGALRDLPSQYETGAGATTRRRITSSYLLALAVTAVMVLGSARLVTRAIEEQENAAALIDRAGAQRMLSQRVAALSALSAEASTADRATRMQGAMQRMAASHTALTVGPNAPARATPELHALYFEGPSPLDAEVAFFLAAAGTAMEALPTDVGAALRDAALGPLLAKLNQAVLLHVAACEASTRSALLANWIATGLILLLLVAEGVLLFRPLARRVSSLAERLEQEASRDAMTGLYNRRSMTALIAQQLAEGRPLSVIAIDLDWFKETNDAEGHAGGDALLRATATRLSELVRAEDAVGRVGGDEFVMLLTGIADRRVADQVAERVRRVLHRPVLFDGRMLRLGGTLGVAAAPADGATADAVLRAADDALSRAKRDGRGGIGRASPAGAARLAREATILRALDALPDRLDGLVAYLQPIVDLTHEGRPPLRAYEALARWHEPQFGNISPGEFLPLAQRTGRLPGVVRQVRLHALRSFAALRSAGLEAPLLSVNLSASELMRGDVADLLAADVAAAGVPLDRIEIEITEEVLLDRVSDRTLRQLVSLREEGVRLALDDFGTGTSTMGQLLRLPIDTVKLDRSFISRLGELPRAEEIVGAAISMGRGLGMEVVAEGVETPAQAAALRRLGCHAAQGFLFARPMPLDGVISWLGNRAAEPDARAESETGR